jgi:hypothetical protein
VAGLDEFARECDAASRALRRVPTDLRRELGREVKEQVAVPLAAKIGAAASGPYARALSGAVKARAQADPTIVIGGSRKVVRGGANARQLVFGTEWGGGKRTTRVAARPGRRGYRRRSTNQFVPAHPFVFSTIGDNVDWVLDRYSDIVLKVLNEAVSDG